jgi:hypothetical protein
LREGFKSQAFTFFAQDGLRAWKLELAGNSHRLVPPIFEELYMSLQVNRSFTAFDSPSGATQRYRPEPGADSRRHNTLDIHNGIRYE